MAARSSMEGLWIRAENSLQHQLESIFLEIYNPYGFSRSNNVDGLADVDFANYPILVRPISASTELLPEPAWIIRHTLYQHAQSISLRAAQIRISILAMASSLCSEADPTGDLRAGKTY